MPTIDDNPANYVGLPDQDAGRFTDDGNHYADLVTGRAVWVKAIPYVEPPPTGGNFQYDHPGYNMSYVPVPSDVGLSSWSDHQEITVRMVNGAFRRFLIENGSPSLKESYEPVVTDTSRFSFVTSVSQIDQPYRFYYLTVQQTVGPTTYPVGMYILGQDGSTIIPVDKPESAAYQIIREDHLGGPVPGAAKIRYVVAQTSAAEPVVTFTPTNGAVAVDVQHGMLLSADMYLLTGAEIQGGAVNVTFTGDGFTADAETRFAIRSSVLQDPAGSGGIYVNTNGFQTGPASEAGAYDVYRINGLIAANHKIFFQF